MGEGSFSALKSQIFDRQERQLHYKAHVRGLNAYERHQKFLNDYVKYYGNERDAHPYHRLPVKTDHDTLREGYRFIRTEEDDLNTTCWEQRLVKRYYDKLFKEYCIADMSNYRTGKIGLRWRTDKEVISGKGQFICGNKHCDKKDGLASYEVNFSYVEAGESKQALVKLVACERCAEKLQYRRKTEKVLECDKRKRARSGNETMDDEYSTGVKRARSEKTHTTSQWKRSPVDDSATEELGREKGRKGKGRSWSMSGDDEGIEEFLEEMFP